MRRSWRRPQWPHPRVCDEAQGGGGQAPGVWGQQGARGGTCPPLLPGHAHATRVSELAGLDGGSCRALMQLPATCASTKAITEPQPACVAGWGAAIRPGIAPLPRGWQGAWMHPPHPGQRPLLVPHPAWPGHDRGRGSAGSCGPGTVCASPCWHEPPALEVGPKPARAGREEQFCSQLQDFGNIGRAGSCCPGARPGSWGWQQTAGASCARLRPRICAAGCGGEERPRELCRWDGDAGRHVGLGYGAHF